MTHCDCHCISTDSVLVGVIIAYSANPGIYEMGRIFIVPEWQNQGLGAQAFDLLWPLYPQAESWHLRTRHFYVKRGFTETGVNDEGLVLFERRMLFDNTSS